MGLKSFIKRLPHEIWSNNEILLLKRSAGIPLDYSKRKEFKGEIIEATDANIEDCGEFEDPKRYVPIYRKMIQNGDIVHFGYIGDHCVFRHAMKNSGTIDYDGAVIKKIVLGKEKYVHYAYTAPCARGRGLHVNSLYIFAENNKDCDFFSLVKENNYVSLKGHFMLGYAPYLRIIVKHRFFSIKVEQTELNEDSKKRIVEACYK